MLKFEEGHFNLNGDPLYIFSGEIHYFRLSSENVQKHLDRALEAGLNTVSTYIPWSWHEYEEGKFDFTGKTHPQRDLAGYLQKVKDSGLYLTVRIGPFSNAELKGEGIPSWLTENYSEIYSKGEGIVNLPHTTLISYINPTFREFVAKWYKQVISHVIPFTVNNGGNIILTQLCNEIGMIQWVNNRGDYSRAAGSMYREYLKDKYGTIDKLNEQYLGSSFSVFDEIKQPAERQKYGWQDFWDWADFYRHYFADYYDFLSKTAAENGIDTPLIANIPQFIDFDTRGRGLASPMTSSFYKYIPQKAGNVVFGGAYQMRHMDYENFHDVCITTQIVKTLTGYSNPVICAELQTGILRDKPRLYASDVELNLKTSMVSGVDGVNCYMFSGGENPDNIGMFGKRHEWQAPVSSDGHVDDKFQVLKEHGQFLKLFGKNLAATFPVYHTTFSVYPPYYGTEFLSDAECGFLVYARDRYFFDGIGRLLNLAGTNFNMINLMDEDSVDPAKTPILWVFSLSFMDEDTQNKLADYMEKGGKLVLFPEFPEFDLSGKKCTVLMDKIGVSIKEKVFESIVKFSENECYVEGGISIVELNSEHNIIATVDGATCAFSKEIGSGKIVFIGSPMPHYYDYHIDVIDTVACTETGMKKNVHTSPKDIIGFVRASEKGAFLFLFNYHEKKYTASVSVDIPGYGISIDEKDIQLNPRSAKILPLNVDLDNNTRIHFSSAEILELGIENGTVKCTLKGVAGENIRLRMNADGKDIDYQKVLDNDIEDISIS